MSERDATPGPADASTLPALLHSAAREFGDATAVTLSGETLPDETLTFREWERRSAQLARGLLAAGIGKGSRVGFMFCNGPGFAVTFAAIARIGAIAIPVSTLIKSTELVRVLRQSDVTGLIVQRSLLGYDMVERLVDALPALATCENPDLRLPDVPFLRWIVTTGGNLPASVRDQQWLDELAASVDDSLLDSVEREVHPADRLLEIYTSGSMALPKGVGHNHGPVLFRTHYLRSMTPAATRGAQRPCPLPMFWVGGLMMYLLPNLACGATTVCTERLESNSRIAMGSVLAQDDEYALPEGWTIWALGMTETLGPYSYADTMRVPGYPLCAPLDHIADRFEVRVADAEGRPVPAGEKGEIQVRGYSLTPGLHKIEREAYCLPDGFLRTGDMGVVEGDRILFVGREGDIIKTASSNVSPAEVEMELQSLPQIHSAYVVGIPDAERGQLLVAALVPREGCTLEPDAITAQLRERLSSFKVPRHFEIFTREEVPMLHSNKVARREIANMIASRLGRT